jgi:type II secretory pathway component GspD/PulD (secretin)
MWSRLLSLSLIFPLATLLPAQQVQPTPEPDSASMDELVSYEASNAPINAVLQEYESLTGMTLIEDSNLMANAVPLTISVPHPVKKAQIIRLIEAALLLNNYALIPGPGEKTMKVINLSTGKNARSEGVRLFTSLENLPAATGLYIVRSNLQRASRGDHRNHQRNSAIDCAERFDRRASGRHLHFICPVGSGRRGTRI